MITKLQFFGSPAHNLATIVTELPRFHFHQYVAVYDLRTFSELIYFIIRLGICILQIGTSY